MNCEVNAPKLVGHIYSDRILVLNAPEIVWDTGNGRWAKPNPYIEISAAGQKLHTTTVQSRTVTPAWNENITM